MDKAYCDYNWWAEIHNKGAYFVTRLKSNAAYQVVSEHEETSGLKSQIVTLTNRSPRGGKKNNCVDIELCLVHVPHPSKAGKHLAVVSNAGHLSGDEIAEIYKKRWDIELLFKFLKQNVKLKRFIGESRNAVLIQIYTGLIAYVLLTLYRKVSRPKSSLFEVLTFIKAHLMNFVERIMRPPTQNNTIARQKCLPFIEN
jgi:putative transposase